MATTNPVVTMSVIQMHCGYYLYQNKIYTDRIPLFDDMVLHADQNVKFCFNEEVFKPLDWTIEPDISLRELYKMRAQQLRDSYDYLILSYSGGADSHEILCTFLENNIFIDEIQVVHYNKGIKNIDRSLLISDSAMSIFLEYELAALPALQQVSKRSPNTKITLLDASDFTINDISKKTFSFLGLDKYKANSTTVIHNTPFTKNFFLQHHNNKNFTVSKKTAFIRGAEKPNLFFKNKKLVFAFHDATLHGVKMMQAGDIDPVYTIENFFWTPDVPLIPIKQSHVIKKVLLRDKQFLLEFIRQLSKKTSIHEHSDIQNFQRKFNRIIYNHWNDQIYKAPKSLNESSDMKLAAMLLGDNGAIKDAMREQRSYFLTKYKNLQDIQLLNKRIKSDDYIIGDISDD